MKKTHPKSVSFVCIPSSDYDGTLIYLSYADMRKITGNRYEDKDGWNDPYFSNIVDWLGMTNKPIRITMERLSPQEARRCPSSGKFA